MKRTPKIIATELLVLKAQLGDKTAFKQLYRLWMPVLYGRCLRQLGQASDAQDAAQKVWLKVIKGIGRLKDPACFAAWILRIGHLTCIDSIRKSSRQNKLHYEFQDNNLPINSELESKLDLRMAIKKLSPSQQQILDLHYLLGFSIGQIAHIWA